MRLDLITLVFVGGLLHFCILIAGALTPGVLDWRNELRSLQPLSRQIVWVHGAFIVMTITAFGLAGTVLAPQLAGAAPAPPARAICGFIAFFWLVRLAIQFLLFKPGKLLSNWFLRLGYHGLTFVFTYFAIVFGWAAVRPA